MLSYSLEPLHVRLRAVKAAASIKPSMELEGIKQFIAEAYGISISDMEGKTRTAVLVDARKLYAHFAKKKFAPAKNLIEIGQSINRDHSTIIHYLKMIEDRLAVDKRFRIHYEKLLTEALCKLN